MADRAGAELTPVHETVRKLAGRHPGVVAGAVTGAGGTVAGAGRTRLPDGPQPDGSTLFEIGSITKVFTALLLADAVTRGELTLDTPVRELLPAGVRAPARDGTQITVEHLATHTSGLPRSPLGLRHELRSALGSRADPYAHLTRDGLYEVLGRTRLRRTPGTGKPSYSNFGAALLGHALVAALDRGDYGPLVEERICGPLGLVDTVVPPDPARAPRIAAGHAFRGREVPHWELPGMAGAGALLSTADDLLAFLRAQLWPHETSLGEAIALTQHERYGGRRTAIGLGWLHMSMRAGTMLWHNGGTGGFRSFAGFVPEAGAAVVVLVNNHRSPDLAGTRLLDACMA